MASGEGVYARRFDAAGTALTGEIRVNTLTNGDQRFAAVVSDAAGNFVVTWTGRDAVAAHDNVYLRRFSAAGAALTAETQVNTSATGDQSNAVIAMQAGSSAFVVAWQGQGAGDADGIFFRRFLADATAQDGTERLATLGSTGSEVNPGVAMDASGNFVVVWERDEHIWFQRFDATGAAQGCGGAGRRLVARVGRGLRPGGGDEQRGRIHRGLPGTRRSAGAERNLGPAICGRRQRGQ